MHLVYPVDLAAIIKNALGKGGLAGVDVGAYTDISPFRVTHISAS